METLRVLRGTYTLSPGSREVGAQPGGFAEELISEMLLKGCGRQQLLSPWRRGGRDVGASAPLICIPDK